GIVDHGRMIALGTKQELCNRLTSGTVITLELNEVTSEFVTLVNDLPFVEQVVTKNETVEIFVTDANPAIGETVSKAVTS
ncbi:export ABC transporter ATP-binding protein, partial [Alkalihalophilus pseudofirmus]|nr:export ABC transporter ATP-binding protein [Alkalihalophilus pseudofirmus]